MSGLELEESAKGCWMVEAPTRDERKSMGSNMIGDASMRVVKLREC